MALPQPSDWQSISLSLIQIFWLEEWDWFISWIKDLAITNLLILDVRIFTSNSYATHDFFSTFFIWDLLIILTSLENLETLSLFFLHVNNNLRMLKTHFSHHKKDVPHWMPIDTILYPKKIHQL